MTIQLKIIFNIYIICIKQIQYLKNLDIFSKILTEEFFSKVFKMFFLDMNTWNRNFVKQM